MELSAGLTDVFAGGLPGGDLPHVLHERLKGYSGTAISTGRSSANVFRMAGSGVPALFLKHGFGEGAAEIEAEASCLRWLKSEGIACAEVIEQVTTDGSVWLLSSEVTGRDVATSIQLAPNEVVAIAAEGLRRLHALNPSKCPFDQRLDRRIDLARERVEMNLVDETDFDAERMGRTARSVFEDLIAHRPRAEDLVVTHGDATFENLMQCDGRFSGFVDCGRLGVADRYRDLALIARSIEDRLGRQWVRTFFDIYGCHYDETRIRYYQILDEFF